MGLTAWLTRWFRAARGKPRVNGRELSGSLRSAVAIVSTDLQAHHIEHALIGGVALSAHGVVRTTLGVDFLIAAEGADHVHQLMSSLGFETIHRSSDVGNYLLKNLRVDFLNAHREYTRAMLDRAMPVVIAGVSTKVVRGEDLVGLKVQALANDPTRAQDRADIENLLRTAQNLDLALVRKYFAIFGKEPELDAILAAHRSRR
jgi:predicted nucleotidyltransferase